MTGWIGISLGDITGIGPEVTLKALAGELGADDTRYLLIGDTEHVRRLDEQLGLKLPVQTYSGKDRPGRIFLCQPLSESLANRPPGGLAGRSARRSCLGSGRRGALLAGEIDALVTAPVNKHAIVRAGQAFHWANRNALANRRHRANHHDVARPGRQRALAAGGAGDNAFADQTRLGAPDPSAKIELAIELAAQACRDLDLPRARIAVCGLNPHAGEGGEMGTEEQTTVGPAVQAARRRQIDVVGPLSADALVLSRLSKATMTPSWPCTTTRAWCPSR
jgi:4-hydroxy-L-threonine phosphate dehydrogenase PdxA